MESVLQSTHYARPGISPTVPAPRFAATMGYYEMMVVPSRNRGTQHLEPRTWPGFQTQFCSKPNPRKWCDGRCDEIVTFVQYSRKNVTFMEELKKNSKPFSVPSNKLKIVTKMWRPSFLVNFVPVTHSKPGLGSENILAMNNPEDVQGNFFWKLATKSYYFENWRPNLNFLTSGFRRFVHDFEVWYLISKSPAPSILFRTGWSFKTSDTNRQIISGFNMVREAGILIFPM